MSIMSVTASTSAFYIIKYCAYTRLSMITIYTATEFGCKSIVDLVPKHGGGFLTLKIFVVYINIVTAPSSMLICTCIYVHHTTLIIFGIE